MNKRIQLQHKKINQLLDTHPTANHTLRNTFTSILACLMLAIAPNALAGIFKCTDANGKQTYSDRPCRTTANKQENYDKYAEDEGEATNQAKPSVLPEKKIPQGIELSSSKPGDETAITSEAKSIPADAASVTALKKQVLKKATIDELISAIKKDDTAEAKRLLEDNPTLKNQIYKGSSTPIHLASKRTNYELVNYLLEKGVDANLKNGHGETPIFTLAKIGIKHRQDIYESTDAIARLLEKHGADFRAQGRDGKSLLKHAAFYGNAYAARIALKQGADVNEQSVNGSTPMHEAAWTGHINILQLLLNFRGNINARDKSGKTPLYGTAWTNKLDVAKFLLKNGAELPKTGYTPLHLAAQHGHIEISEYFIGLGVSVNAQDNGSTPLHIAAWTGQDDYIDWIFNKGAKINAQNQFGETALHIAAKWGKVKTVELLLSLGANKNIADKNGNLPKDLASQKSDTDVLAILQ